MTWWGWIRPIECRWRRSLPFQSEDTLAAAGDTLAGGKKWYQDCRSDVGKWMCSAMFFFFLDVLWGKKKDHLISLGYFLLWDIEATWYDFGDIFRCVLKLLCFIVWSNDGMGQPVPRQINVQSNLSPANWRLKNLALREIAVWTLNGF